MALFRQWDDPVYVRPFTMDSGVMNGTIAKEQRMVKGAPWPGSRWATEIGDKVCS